ncbi:MAG: glycine cleavage system protein GcvH [Spirochaetaceae bacterium]|nr:MAG: glycine cleavage system protein GcvH [Spirochaetaceae bacterium]
MTFRDDVKYQESHEWALKDDNLVIVGISDYAQDSLGDVVYVELPDVGDVKKKGDSFGVVESVKAASDVYMPVSGEIIEINADLDDNPSNVNDSPFDSGWLIKIKPSDPSELDSLMSAQEYKTYTEGLEE